MRPWHFHSAGSLMFGRDSVRQLGTVCGRLRAARVFVVTDNTLVGAGLLDRVTAPLTAAGVDTGAFTGGQPEPTAELARGAIAAARAFHPDAILGLGGGSNM